MTVLAYLLKLKQGLKKIKPTPGSALVCPEPKECCIMLHRASPLKQGCVNKKQTLSVLGTLTAAATQATG